MVDKFKELFGNTKTNSIGESTKIIHITTKFIVLKQTFFPFTEFTYKRINKKHKIVSEYKKHLKPENNVFENVLIFVNYDTNIKYVKEFTELPYIPKQKYSTGNLSEIMPNVPDFFCFDGCWFERVKIY